MTATASASWSMPLWILMRAFMSNVKFLASAFTLSDARRELAPARVALEVTLLPVKACKCGEEKNGVHVSTVVVAIALAAVERFMKAGASCARLSPRFPVER